MTIVEFALKFKDMASAGIASFASRTSQSMQQARQQAQQVSDATSHVGQSFNRAGQCASELGRAARSNMREAANGTEETKRETDNLGRSYDKAAADVSEFGRKARAEMREVGDSTDKAGKKTEGGFSVGNMIKSNLGASAIISAAQTAAGLFTDSMSAAMERQTIQTSFNVIAGDKGKGSALTSQLVELQKDTVLGSEVFQNAQTMMSMGFDSTEVVKNMKMLGDVSMGDANKLGSLTLAFSQVKASGKMNGGDLMQFINAGFNPLQQMSETTGKSMATLKDEMSKGLITFDDVQKSFQAATSEGGKFHNMLGQIAETPAGKLQALSGEVDELKVNAGQAFMPLVTMAMNFAEQSLPIISSFVDPLAHGVTTVVGLIAQAKPYFVQMLRPAVDFVRQLADSTQGWMGWLSIIKNLFMTYIYPYALKLSSAVFSIVGRIVTFVANSVLLKDVFSLICSNLGRMFSIVGYIVDGLSGVFNNIVMPILNAIEMIYRFALKIKAAIFSMVGRFIVKPVLNAFEMVYHYALKIKAAIFSMVGRFVTFVTNSVILKNVFSLVGSILGRLFSLVGYLVDGLSWVFNKIVKPIINAIGTVYRAIKGEPMKVATSASKALPKPKPSNKAENVTNIVAKPADNQQNTDLLRHISKNTEGNREAAKQQASTISGGGQKVVNIRLNKFFDNIQFINKPDIKANVKDLEQQVLECLSRVLANGAITE